MKGNPAVPGGSLTSKPTWSNTSECSTTSAFLFPGTRDGTQAQGTNRMDKSKTTKAQQLAQAASAFERQRTGRMPKSVTVVLSEDTLVITLHGALSPAEKALAQSPAGAAQVHEFHRQLFANSSKTLREEVKRITGVEVREATAEVETTTGTVMKVFTTGTVVQVFLLAHSVAAGTWSESVPSAP
jgi:uncharacterized protein YbcI